MSCSCAADNNTIERGKGNDAGKRKDILSSLSKNETGHGSVCT